MGLLSRVWEVSPYAASSPWAQIGQPHSRLLQLANQQQSGSRDIEVMRAGVQSAGPLGGAPPQPAPVNAAVTPQMGVEWQSPAMLPQPPQIPNGAAAMTQGKVASTQYAGAPDGRYGGRLQDRFSTWVDNLGNNRLFNIGAALIANSGNGGDGQGFLRSMQDFNAQQMEQRRLNNEERRQKAADNRDATAWTRQTQEWERSDQERAALSDWVATLSPEDQAAARANPQAAYAAFMEAHAAATMPVTPFQQAQLNLQERELASNERIRRSTLAYQQSQDQWMRRFQGALGAADASTVAEQGALVNRAVTTVRPILQEMRSIIDRYPDIMGSWINTADRTQLVRMAGGDPQRLAAMERFQGLATQLTLPQLETLRPATNLDFERVRSTVADPQMSRSGALAYIDSQIQELDRALSVQNSQGQWIAQYGSLSLPNEQGQTWAQSVNNAPFMQFNPQSPQSIAGAAAGAQAQTPQRGDVVDGYRFMGGDPADRRNWVRINGGSTPQAARGNRPGAF